MNLTVEHGTGKKASGAWTSVSTVVSGERLEVLLVGREFPSAEIAEHTWLRLASSAKKQHGGSSVFRLAGASGMNNVIAAVGRGSSVRRVLRMMQPKGVEIQIPDDHVEQLFLRWLRVSAENTGHTAQRHELGGGVRINDDGTTDHHDRND